MVAGEVGQPGPHQHDDQSLGPLGETRPWRAARPPRRGTGCRTSANRARDRAGRRAASTSRRAARSTTPACRTPRRRRCGRSVESSTAPNTDPPPVARATAPSTMSSITNAQTSRVPTKNQRSREEDHRTGDGAEGADDGDDVRGEPGARQARTERHHGARDRGAGMDVQHCAPTISAAGSADLRCCACPLPALGCRMPESALDEHGTDEVRECRTRRPPPGPRRPRSRQPTGRRRYATSLSWGTPAAARPRSSRRCSRRPGRSRAPARWSTARRPATATRSRCPSSVRWRSRCARSSGTASSSICWTRPDIPTSPASCGPGCALPTAPCSSSRRPTTSTRSPSRSGRSAPGWARRAPSSSPS